MGCSLCGDKEEKAIRVSFCPKCKSRGVKYVFEFKNIFGVLPKMRCLKCGNEAPSFPILVTSKKLLEASEKTKAKNKKGKNKNGGKNKK